MRGAYRQSDGQGRTRTTWDARTGRQFARFERPERVSYFPLWRGGPVAMAFLKVIVGPNSGQTCRLTASECVLGRHPGCDFPIDDEAASRRHARIVLAGSDHYLEDLDSRNGTFLNGERIQQRREIADGDRLRIGKTIFTFHLQPSSPASEGHPLIRGKGSLLLVDDEELEGDRALLSKRGASSGQATMPSNIT